MYSQSDGSDRKIISQQTDYRRICHLPSHNSKGKKPYGFFPFFDCRDDRTFGCIKFNFNLLIFNGAYLYY